MYLHAGNNKNIREKDIIGIFDADNCTISSVTRKYLSSNEKNHSVETVADEIPKSFIVYESEGEFKICFSPLSTSALLGRMINRKAISKELSNQF